MLVRSSRLDSSTPSNSFTFEIKQKMDFYRVHCALLLPSTSYPTFTFFSHFTRYVLSSYASFLSCIFWHTFLYSNSIFNLRSFLPPLSLFLFMFFNSKYAPSVHYVAVFPPSAITFGLPLISFLPSCLPLSLFLRLFTKSPSPPNCYGPLYS